MSYRDLEEGIRASEALALGLYGVDIAKALDPLDPLDFVTITLRLGRALRGAVTGTEAQALKSAIEKLDVNWPGLSAARRSEIIRAARQEVTHMGDAVDRAERKLERSADEMVHWTRAASVKRYGLQVVKSPTDFDLDTVYRMRTSQMMYIRDEYGKRVDLFDYQAKQIVGDGLAAGLGRDDISEDLATQLADSQINRSRAYWDLIANDFSNKGRTATQLNAFGDAGVAIYRYESVMDQVTSAICRFLHGREFTVKVASQKLQQSFDLDDPEDIQDVRPWLRQDGDQLYYQSRSGDRTVVADIRRSGVGRADDGGDYHDRLGKAELEAAGVTCPPSHARCRANIIAEG